MEQDRMVKELSKDTIWDLDFGLISDSLQSLFNFCMLFVHLLLVWVVQPPLNSLENVLDVVGEKYDFYVIGFQEAPNFSAEALITQALGDTYWWILLFLLLFLALLQIGCLIAAFHGICLSGCQFCLQRHWVWRFFQAGQSSQPQCSFQEA